MRDELLDFISEYSFKPTQQEKEKDLGGKAKKDHKAWKDFKKIEESVAAILSKNGSPFEVDGQCGNSGRWLNIPYIRIFDKKTAPNASKGVYITYLFSDDGKSLVLSLSLGGSGYDKKNLSDKEIMSLSDAISAQFAGKTSFSTGYTQGLLGTSNRAKGYEIGLPLFKKYNIGNLPSEAALIKDLNEICDAYSAYLANNPGPDSSTQNATNATTSNKTIEFPKNLIFFGAPGTGKTYKTVNQAVAICLKKSIDEINAMDRGDLTKQYRDLIDAGNITFVTFHQSYSYEDFVIGIFPELATGATPGSNGIRYICKDGVFKVLCDTARNHPDTNFVLIIDEINRGNISKIFGELITLIEESKREGQEEETRVLLPYLDNKNIIRFSVPSNVYIIGTMNTADRSIQHIDTALRRRFVFEEVLPDYSLFKGIDIKSNNQTLRIDELLRSLNRRITRYFDREHVIGHTYFLPLKENGLSDKEKLEKLGKIFREKIIPLLQDYFFEDYAKIQKVFGEDADTDDAKSLIRKAEDNIHDEDDEGRDVYEVAEKGDAAYTNIETYVLMTE